ncbi:MAG: hypothetical protein QM777_21955 [Pseudorhodoferax sp.]
MPKIRRIFSTVPKEEPSAAQPIVDGPHGQRVNNQWYRFLDGDSVIVFVHGIFSNSVSCWSSKNGEYWPALVEQDTRFNSLSIYLGGYYTDFSSGIYRVSDAANELLSSLRTSDTEGRAPLLEKRNILFVAHSTGGLIVRYMLDRFEEQFAKKAIGLVLLASPSRGSAWSNRVAWLRDLYGNKMAGQLARDNDFIVDLDARFADLVASKRIPGMVGLDAFESKFIIPGIVTNSTHVVSAQDSASYFGAYRIVPNSDHFSIAKPQSLRDAPHQLLLEFYETVFIPSLRRAADGKLGSRLIAATLLKAWKTKIRELVFANKRIVQLAVERRRVGELCVLPDVTIEEEFFDFVVLRVEGPSSNAGDGITLVRLLDPSESPNTKEISSALESIENILRQRTTGELICAALEERDDFRGYPPLHLMDRKAIIFVGRREALSKKEIDSMRRRDYDFDRVRTLTYDSFAEELDATEEQTD